MLDNIQNFNSFIKSQDIFFSHSIMVLGITFFSEISSAWLRKIKYLYLQFWKFLVILLKIC